MPEIEKKEPGQPDVVQPERGDPRQHWQPTARQPTPVPVAPAQDRPPEFSPRGEESPWMGGG
jgi:hypothetical protein